MFLFSWSNGQNDQTDETIKKLKEEELVTRLDLTLLTDEDITSYNFKTAQRNRLRHAVERLRESQSSRQSIATVEEPTHNSNENFVTSATITNPPASNEDDEDDADDDMIEIPASAKDRNAEKKKVELQRECDKLRTDKEKSREIQHEVSVENKRAFVLCHFCKETLALGSFDQGLKNFKTHLKSNKHVGMMADYFCEDAPSEIVSELVVEMLENSDLTVKNGAVYCKPCRKLFAKDASQSNLRSNVKQHLDSSGHISSKSQTSINNFFTPVTKKKKD